MVREQWHTDLLELLRRIGREGAFKYDIVGRLCLRTQDSPSVSLVSLWYLVIDKDQLQHNDEPQEQINKCRRHAFWIPGFKLKYESAAAALEREQIFKSLTFQSESMFVNLALYGDAFTCPCPPPDVNDNTDSTVTPRLVSLLEFDDQMVKLYLRRLQVAYRLALPQLREGATHLTGTQSSAQSKLRRSKQLALQVDSLDVVSAEPEACWLSPTMPVRCRHSARALFRDDPEDASSWSVLYLDKDEDAWVNLDANPIEMSYIHAALDIHGSTQFEHPILRDKAVVSFLNIDPSPSEEELLRLSRLLVEKPDSPEQPATVIEEQQQDSGDNVSSRTRRKQRVTEPALGIERGNLGMRFHTPDGTESAETLSQNQLSDPPRTRPRLRGKKT